MIIGTSHFKSRRAAEAYFAKQGLTAADIQDKLLAGEIHIGKPELERGETTMFRSDEPGRYSIKVGA